jgi:hypothetical protein
MTTRSAAATEVARRLWAGEVGDGDAPGAVAAAAERVCARLRVGLGRWVGTDGYRALLHRALGLARAEFPPLTDLSCYGGDGSEMATAVRTHGPAEVTASVVGLMATLIDLLSNIVGEELAARLVEETGTASPAESSSTRTEGGRDG